MLRVEGSYCCKAPKSVVGEEYFIRNKYYGKGGYRYGQCENDTTYQLILGYLNASFFKVYRELLVVTLDSAYGK